MAALGSMGQRVRAGLWRGGWSAPSGEWPHRRMTTQRGLRRDRLGAVLGLLALAGFAIAMADPGARDDAPPGAGAGFDAPDTPARDVRRRGTETLIGGYIGAPYHLRSDAHLVRPDGTDLTLRGLQWDGEPFKFPVYGGARVVRWHGPVGYMIDFLHDKAIARTGKGAHGAKVTGERAIVDSVVASGTHKGRPVSSPVKLTDVLERLEFSHGHNMLLPTALVRLGGLSPRLRPYAGIGGGLALPHVEVWPAGEGNDARTNEYQVAGPAAQVVLGLELRGARGSYFVEYKFTFAWLHTLMTGNKTPAWCNCDAASDLWRQLAAWWRGAEPRLGRFDTWLATHQVVGGFAYRWRGAGPP